MGPLATGWPCAARWPGKKTVVLKIKMTAGTRVLPAILRDKKEVIFMSSSYEPKGAITEPSMGIGAVPFL
jgi:hypothetical protein